MDKLKRLLGVYKPQEITVELQYEVLKRVYDIVFGEAYAHDFCSLTRTERQNMFMMYERLVLITFLIESK